MLKRSLVLLVLAVVAATASVAQAPDCTGVSVAPPLSGVDYSNQLTAVRIATGFSSPVAITSAPGDHERLFVVERAGTIDIIKNGVVLGAPFLNIDALTNGDPNGASASETGLLGLAFHPDYQNNGYFYVYYTNNVSDVIVARYTRSTPDLADAGSAKQILFIDEPFPNHNGGTLMFGPDDGYLYLGIGDGGASCDPGPVGSGNAQNLNTLLGKMLRIDVDVDPDPYAIPPDNPFVDVAGLDEIWAYGLRNPFRFSIDRIHGTLMIGDVGQDEAEEVNCVPGSSTGGENYGWVVFEGAECSSTQSCAADGGSCTVSNYVPPILTYLTASGHSVIGGPTYQGCRMPVLGGTYFYANYSWNNTVNDNAMFLRSFRVDSATCGLSVSVNRHIDLKSENATYLFQRIAGFGEDQQGEIYFVDQYDGEVYKILPILRLMEVSGLNAVPFRLDPTEWTWEDLQATSAHPISGYKVFRSIGNAVGPFECAFEGPTPSWPGGDPATPLPDEVYYYLALGLNAAGELTRPGFQSDGTPRTVLASSICP